MNQPPVAPLRGRPRSFDEERVLDEVLEIFWKRGYQTTTTRDLEAALGLSQSSIYNTFGSKADLLDTALDRYERRTEASLLFPLEGAENGIDGLDRFFVDLGDWVTADGRRGCMLINMMAEDGGETENVRHRTRRYRRRVRGALYDALVRGSRVGTIADESLDLKADLLMGLVLGLNIAARGGAADAEIDRLIAGARYQIASWRRGHR